MLLHRIELFLKLSGMKPTRFGREALGDPRFVFDLRFGREPRPATVKRVESYLRDRERLAA
jgi:hypothetical protein